MTKQAGNGPFASLEFEGAAFSPAGELLGVSFSGAVSNSPKVVRLAGPPSARDELSAERSLESLTAVPEGIPLEFAAMSDQYGAAMRVAHGHGPRPADATLVIGGRPLGLVMTQVMLAAGVGSIYFLDPHPECRRVIGAMGCRTLSMPGDENDLGSLKEALGGHGADVVVECSGEPALRRLAIELARPAGRIIFAHGDERSVRLNTNLLVMTDKRVQGHGPHTAEDVRRGVGLAAACRVDAAALVREWVTVDGLEASPATGSETCLVTLAYEKRGVGR